MPRYLRRRAFRPRRRGVPPVLPPLLIAAVAAICFFGLVSARLRPMIKAMAVSKATNLISAAVSGAVDDCLTREGLDYDDFITLTTDGAGKIVSLTGKPAEGSRFRRQVVSDLAECLETISPEEFGIPLGTLTNRLLLSGLGPDVRVKIQSIGDMTAEYSNSFSAAGVNQTLHSIYLDVTVTVYLLIPGEIVPVTVEDSVCVAETVIVGEVPTTYIQLGNGEN